MRRWFPRPCFLIPKTSVSTLEGLIVMNDHSSSAAPGVSGLLALEPAADCGRFSLRARIQDLAPIGEALGWPLPERIGGMTAAGDKLVLCLGPDEWQLLLPEEEMEPMARRVAALSPRLAASLVDIGSREIGIEIQGPKATSALCAACAFDIEGMASGTATRTVLDRVPVILIKRGAEHYRIEVWRSFAGHVWKLLETVKREIELAI